MLRHVHLGHRDSQPPMRHLLFTMHDAFLGEMASDGHVLSCSFGGDLGEMIELLPKKVPRQPFDRENFFMAAERDVVKRVG